MTPLPDDLRQKSHVRILTYNVHQCRGLDRRWMPERIANVIASCQPDIVALQELDVRRIRSGNVDQAEIIAHSLEMNVHFFPAIRVMEESYGDAILSRWPATLKKAEALPGFHGFPGVEPRGALWAEISVAGSPLQIINTHLGLFRAERRKQIEALLGPDWLDHPDCTEPIVLAGDFNMTPGSYSYRRVTGRLLDAQRAEGGMGRNAATFPTRFPAFALDHIFVSNSVQVIHVEAVRTPLARIASDHFPIVADVRLSGVDAPTNERERGQVTTPRNSLVHAAPSAGA